MAKTINVFINGPGQKAEQLDGAYVNYASLANLLHALAKKADDIINLCLDGSGVNNSQAVDFDVVLEKIKSTIQTNKFVTLNLFGYSRGAAMVFLLCKKLKEIPEEQLVIHAAAFEPISSDSVTISCLDTLSGFNTTLAAQIADLRDCNNLKRLQVLFTHESIPKIAAQEPLLPILPKNCWVDVDVTAGNSKDAQRFQVYWKGIIKLDAWCAGSNKPGYINSKPHICAENLESLAVYHQVVDFFEASGMAFDFSQLNLEKELADRSIANQLEIINDAFRPMYENVHAKTAIREMHYGNIIKKKASMLIDPASSSLNLYHQRLKGEEENPGECMLVVKNYNPVPTYSNGQKNFGLFRTLAIVSVAAAVSVAVTTIESSNSQ